MQRETDFNPFLYFGEANLHMAPKPNRNDVAKSKSQHIHMYTKILKFINFFLIILDLEAREPDHDNLYKIRYQFFLKFPKATNINFLQWMCQFETPPIDNVATLQLTLLHIFALKTFKNVYI